MKKLLGFIILCIPLYVWGDNLIFNPNFDMTPWDTGWTIEELSGYVEIDSSKWLSSPQSCRISASIGTGLAEARIYQEVEEIENCICRIYYQYSIDATNILPCYIGHAWVKIFVKENSEWVNKWEKIIYLEEEGYEEDKVLIWTKWEKIYSDTDSITVSGIKFESGAHCGNGRFWIDDVSVSGVGVKEDSRLQMADCKVDISPNPFIQFTTIKYHMPIKSKVSLEIYDITGRTVKTLVNEEKETGSYNISFSAKDLTAGIYFAKLVAGDFKEMKKLTILR